MIPASGYLVFCAKSDSDLNGNITCDYDWENFFLSNNQDEILIYDEDNQLIDFVYYDYANGAGPNGSSVYRIDNQEDATLWAESENQIVDGCGDFGTPGK